MNSFRQNLNEVARFTLRSGGLAVDQLKPVPQGGETPRAFALIHYGRCGSTVLGSLLDQHPRLYWDGEAMLYHRKSERWLRRLQGARGQSRRRDLSILMRYARGRTYVLSAKGPFGYPNRRHLVDDLLTLGFERFAVLERTNTLRQLVSTAVGVQHKVWVLPPRKASTIRSVKIPLKFPNGDTLVGRIRSLQNGYREVREALSGMPVLELSYESDILDDPESAYQAVCAYLGIERVPVRIPYKRVNPFPLRQLILNYDEVDSVLRGSGFEWMLAG